MAGVLYKLFALSNYPQTKNGDACIKAIFKLLGV